MPPFGLLCMPQPVVSICTIPLDDLGLGTCRVVGLNANWAGLTFQFQAFSLGTSLLTNAETVHL